MDSFFFGLSFNKTYINLFYKCFPLRSVQTNKNEVFTNVKSKTGNVNA